MKSERTICIFFEDLTPKAQDRIISTELLMATDEEVSNVGIKDTDMEPYGYDPDPDKQEMLQDIHVEVTYGGKQHYWLMVWDCMEAEFQTIMEENQNG